MMLCFDEVYHGIGRSSSFFGIGSSLMEFWGVGIDPPLGGVNVPLTLFPFFLRVPLVFPAPDLGVPLFRVVFPSTFPSTA